MQFGLSENIIAGINKIFEENAKIDKAIIFGSRAKGNYKPGSDIDIALKGQHLTFDDILKLHAKLDDLNMAYEIDLLNYDTIKEAALQENIDRAGIVFYERWQKYILDEIITKFVDYRGKTPKKTLAGIPLITAKIIKEGRILEPNEFIAEEDYESWMTRGFPEKNDIILTTEAPLGEVALIKNTRIALAQRIITLQTNKEICDSIFLKYYLESNEGQGVLQARASGSTVEGIKASELKKIEVKLPPLTEQKQISSILLSLDDKIDLLHRQNKTLEQLAETLFRQWFVEEAEESWEVGKIDDIVSIKGGTTPSTTNPDFWNGGIHWTSPRDLSNSNSIFLFDTERKISEKGLAQIGSGLLPINTVLLSSRAPIGYLTITEIPVAINQGYIGIICDKIVSSYFIFLWLKSNINFVINAANGSVFLEISKSTFRELELQIPPKEKLKLFDEVIDPIFMKIKTNNIEIKSLAELRDFLLSKLMNGEVRV